MGVKYPAYVNVGRLAHNLTEARHHQGFEGKHSTGQQILFSC
jgi:hypothetical protein